jgi:hypothetical protein
LPLHLSLSAPLGLGRRIGPLGDQVQPSLRLTPRLKPIDAASDCGVGIKHTWSELAGLSEVRAVSFVGR